MRIALLPNPFQQSEDHTMIAHSVFRKLPPEITDMIYHLVGEGHTLSHPSDPEKRVALPGPVYDSLVSLDIYLWDEQIHCTSASTDRYGALRRYRRTGCYFLDDVLPCHVPFEISCDDLFINRISWCLRVLANLPNLRLISPQDPTGPRAAANLNERDLFDFLKLLYTNDDFVKLD